MTSDQALVPSGDDTAEKRPPAEFGVNMIAEMVAQMSRLLMSLAASASFKTAGIGLTEWIALNLIATTEGVTNKMLSKRLGITPQRVAQISESLKASGMIEAMRAENDSRKKILGVTDKGRKQLAAIDDTLKMTLVDPFKQDANLMARTNRGLKRFNRMLTPKEVKDAATHDDVAPPVDRN